MYAKEENAISGCFVKENLCLGGTSMDNEDIYFERMKHIYMMFAEMPITEKEWENVTGSKVEPGLTTDVIVEKWNQHNQEEGKYIINTNDFGFEFGLKRHTDQMGSILYDTLVDDMREWKREVKAQKKLLKEKKEEYERENPKKNLFVDLDGTAAVFQQVDTLETLYEKDYFLNLKPHRNVVEAVRKLVVYHPEINVYILSSVLTDSKYALKEKNEWIDKYMPEIDRKHRIFPPCGADKKDYIPGGVKPTDFLWDDYSQNLNAWEPPAKGIKLMNGINGTKGTWQSERLSVERSGDELVEAILNIMEGKAHYRDEGPKQPIENKEIPRCKGGR